MEASAAWPQPDARARGSAAADGVVLRRVSAPEEYAACVDLQNETWGDGFTERVPTTILRVAQYVGGVTAGAFAADGRLLGFVFGITGVRDGDLVHWSDMLAVRPDARDHGLGTRLKRYQRELLKPLGVRAMFWTFDPLVARNAHLNLNRLGARVAEYVPDMYGPDTGSALHGPLGTDRFIVRWDLAAPDAGDPGAGGAGAAGDAAPAPIVNEPRDGVGAPADGDLVDAPAVCVEVPYDISRVVADAPAVARRWRETTRRAFVAYLSRGYEVAAFDRGSGRACYRLVRT